MRISELPSDLFNAPDYLIKANVPKWALTEREEVPIYCKDPFGRAWSTFRSTGLSPVAFSAISEVPAAEIVDYFKEKGWQASLCTAAWVPIFQPGGHTFYDMYSGEAKKRNAVKGEYCYTNCTKPDCMACSAFRDRVAKLNAMWEPLPESLDAFLERFGHLSDFQFAPWKFGTYNHGERRFTSPEACFKALRKAFWLEER